MRWLLAFTLASALPAVDQFVASALIASGDQLLKQGRPAEAILPVAGATEVAPDSGWAWYRLGRAYQATGQSHEKRMAFQRARTLAPDDCEIAKALAYALLLSGDPQAALAHYDVRPLMGVIHMDCWGAGQCASSGISLPHAHAFPSIGFVAPRSEQPPR